MEKMDEIIVDVENLTYQAPATTVDSRRIRESEKDIFEYDTRTVLYFIYYALENKKVDYLYRSLLLYYFKKSLASKWWSNLYSPANKGIPSSYIVANRFIFSYKVSVTNRHGLRTVNAKVTNYTARSAGELQHKLKAGTKYSVEIQKIIDSTNKKVNKIIKKYKKVNNL